MGLFKKFSDLVRSNINSWLDKAENTHKLNELAILEAQESKNKAENLLIKTMAALKLHKNQIKAWQKQNDPRLEAQISEALREQELQEKNTIIIKNGIKSLENYISFLKNKRAQDASSVTDSSAFETFARMEEKIENSEAELEALKELLGQEEKNSSLEEELEELKKKLGK